VIVARDTSGKGVARQAREGSEAHASGGRGGAVTIARTIAEARAALADLPRPVGLVPTMGALHEGHLALVAAAARECATVAVSIFVNPTQFAPGEDLARYPRDEARDVALASGAGATFFFAPAVAEMYREGAATTVHVDGPLAGRYEAAQRPGHFDGVATIVTKLLTIVAPERAYFGRKDAQQLAVVRRLVADLDPPVEIVAVETVREADGLAMSSRNVYLTAAERAKAPELHRALLAGRAVAGQGARAVVNEVIARLVIGFPSRLAAADADAPRRPAFSVDYVAVVDPASFAPVDEAGAVPPESLIVAAARLGATRLLDNVAVGAATPDDTIPDEPDPHRGPASRAKE